MYPQDYSPQQLSLLTEASQIYQGHPFRFFKPVPSPSNNDFTVLAVRLPVRLAAAAASCHYM